MAINNEPKWVDVESEGEYTGEKYFGRFLIKPYLNHGERADAVRLAERYCRGIDKSEDQKFFLTTMAFLRFHIVEADAKWWDNDGLSLHDENPVYSITEKINEVQNPPKPEAKEEEPKSSGV